MRFHIDAVCRSCDSTAFNYYRRALYSLRGSYVAAGSFSERIPATSKMVNWHDPILILRDTRASPIVALTRCRPDKLPTSRSHQAASRPRQYLHVRSPLYAEKAHTDLDLHL